MTYMVFFVQCYVVLQLYVVALRKSTTLTVVALLFLVGAFGSAPVALAVEEVFRYHFGLSAVAAATIEEIVKLAPAYYLLFRTPAGMSASVLDGMLFGAAVGGGFGFTEHAIYMIENARPPSNLTYEPLFTILFTWLPGGWPNGAVWFPGHAVISAMAGLGLGVGRRLCHTRHLRIGIPVAFLLWAILLHADFNDPPASSSWGVGSILFRGMSGSGTYISGFLLLAIIVVLIVEEARIVSAFDPGKAAALPELARPKGVFSDLGVLAPSLRHGWQDGRLAFRLLRHKAELVQYAWESAHSNAPRPVDPARLRWFLFAVRMTAQRLEASLHGPRAPLLASWADLVAASEALVARVARPWRNSARLLVRWRVANGGAPSPVNEGGTLSNRLHGLWSAVQSTAAHAIPWKEMLRILSIVVSVYGLWVVFISPLQDHGQSVAFIRSSLAWHVGALGQVLMFVALWRFVRWQRPPTSPDATAATAHHCRAALAWGGAFMCLYALKREYDLSQLTYPFVPATIVANWDQLVQCVSPPAIPPTIGSTTGPVPLIVEGEGEASDLAVLFGSGDASGETPTTDASSSPDDGLPPPKPHATRDPLNMPLGDEPPAGGSDGSAGS
jgi:RsiW-degrading membrane proteinase PrsW (M82 family)